MASSLAAKRYAQALFEIAMNYPVSTQAADGLLYDIGRVAGLRQDPTIAGYLANPRVSLEDKTKRLSDILGQTHPMLPKLLGLLIVKSKLGLLAAISEEYRRLIDAHRGIQRAQVISAVPLDEEIQFLLSQRLSQLAGKRVVLELGIDPGLVGGLRVRLSDRLLDGSIKAKLSSLRRSLIS